MFLLAINNSTFSQSQNNPISILRYNDNFNYLKTDSVKRGLNKLKYIELYKSASISFGGEIREQYQYFQNQNFGDVPPTFEKKSVGQLWHRVMLHSNIELNSRIRLFVQLNSTFTLFNPNPITPEIDENQLSLHQAFLDFSFNKKSKIRLGRQELGYGNNRILAYREGPNTRLTFDGIIFKYNNDKRNIDLLAITPIISKQYIFDDDSYEEYVYGMYGTEIVMPKKILLDYYMLGFSSKKRKYNFNSGEENRQVFGFRFFSKNSKLNYEFEGTYQTGTFNKLNIDAYGISGNINYKVLQKANLVFGVTVNYFTGDKNKNDNKLNTYNSIFSKPQFGLSAPIGSSNIQNFHPYVQFTPVKKLFVETGVYFISRQSTQDGTYSPGMAQIRITPPNSYTSDEKRIGTQYSLETNYQFNQNLSFAIDAAFFQAGKYVKETGKGLDISYISGRTTFKF